MKIRVQKLIKKCQKSQKTSKNVIFRDFHYFYWLDKNGIFDGLRFHGFFRISRVKKQKITKNHEKTRDFFRGKNWGDQMSFWDDFFDIIKKFWFENTIF